MVDNRLAQVMSLSYAGCEDGSALYYQDLALQANAEGITWVAAAGDSGAAGCDAISSAAAVNGLAVTSPASVPQVTAVGGTAFADGSSSEYWRPPTTQTEGRLSPTYPKPGGAARTRFWEEEEARARCLPEAGYQSDFNTAAIAGRLVPDVALAAAPSPVPYLIVDNGTTFSSAAGTSAPHRCSPALQRW